MGLLPSLRKALQFSRAWRSPPSTLRESEVLIPVREGASPIPGTIIRPEGSEMRGWVVLHGMTRLGRAHSELGRFVRAIASTGASVLVPEIREWTELEFAPRRAQAILRGAVDWLYQSPAIEPGGITVAGFSFGAPQALFAAADVELGRKIRGVLGWGGYADIERTFRFSFIGEHEWDGVSYRQRPDPYARWVIGRNCIPLSASLADHTALVAALHRLAVEAGEKRLQTWDPASDPVKEELRRRLPPRDRSLFDVFAPPVDREPDPGAAEALVSELVPAIRREIPLLEPVPLIDRLTVPVRLLHGRSDHLIPFTETLRLGHALDSKASDLSTRLTGLFSHSGGSAGGGLWTRTRENIRFLGALQGIFEVADG